MESVTTATNTTSVNKQMAFGIWFNKKAIQFEESRFGAMAMMIGIQSCLGSIAAGLTYSNESIVALGICASFTMLNNSVLLAQGPAKWCVGAFYAGIIANTLVILSSLI